MPIGHAINPNICMVSSFSCHHDRDTAIARGLEGFEFFGFALGSLYGFGEHKPGRTDLWKEFQNVHMPSVQEQLGNAGTALTGGRGGIGTPDDLREHLLKFEKCGVDQVTFIQQAGMNQHEHICESLEIFAAEVMGEFKERAFIEMRATNNSLVAVVGDKEMPLERRGSDRFYTPSVGFDRYFFVFGRDADGAIVDVSHGAQWYTSDSYSGPDKFDIPADWHNFVGRYRNFSPWFPYFEILISRGALVVVTGEGGETSSGSTRLVPLGTNRFQVGEELTPERLEFFDIVDGRATRASWSGHQFYRQ